MKTWQGHPVSDHVVDANGIPHLHWEEPLRKRIEFLKGFDYRAALGPDTKLDQVKFTRWKPSHCDCEVTYVWHRDSSEDERVHHPQDQHVICDAHREHEGDIKGHHTRLNEESKSLDAAARSQAKETLEEFLTHKVVQAKEFHESEIALGMIKENDLPQIIFADLHKRKMTLEDLYLSEMVFGIRSDGTLTMKHPVFGEKTVELHKAN